MARKPVIQAIKVEYTVDALQHAKRLEVEQASFWLARLNETKPNKAYTVQIVRTPYVDDINQPLFFIRIDHVPTKKVMYARNLEIIEGK